MITHRACGKSPKGQRLLVHISFHTEKKKKGLGYFNFGNRKNILASPLISKTILPSDLCAALQTGIPAELGINGTGRSSLKYEM